MERLKLLAAGLAMLTVAALPALAQSVNGDEPETSPTPVLKWKLRQRCCAVGYLFPPLQHLSGS